ncbi:coiled-coil domain-containing protein 57-like isoform X2 [Pyxicephalus adspersus]|uniref:coiled-coil domain-containing protein 57-like isoform X2 n=1 Tax=Pyxicephalus adspersus TaxID=30357 RepID=UPI003B59AA0F
MLSEERDLTNLLAKKEQEWKELQLRQIVFLQQSLKDAQKNHKEQKDKFDRLKKDFTHNLKVLAEREHELEQCEVMLRQLKVLENSKQSEISDLRVQIEKLQQELQREKKKYNDIESLYQMKIKEHQIEVDRVNSFKNTEIDRHLEEYEKIKRQLERKIEEVQGDLTLQRQELCLEFDCEIKKREHEFRVRLDEMSTVVLSHELKVKLLTKELDVMREMELKGTESLQHAEKTHQSLKEALRQKDFEMKNLLAVKDARIKELNGNVQTLQHQLKIQEEDFQLKHEQLDRCARERESALTSMKEAHNDQVQVLEKQKKELQMCVETLQMEQQRTQCNQQAVLEEKDSTIAKLKDDVDTLKTGWDSYIRQASQDTVNKDLQIQSLQETKEKLKAQIPKCQKDIGRYQQQLAGSVERERLLEQARVQVELDWQKRCEGIERTQYQKSEQLIEGLSNAKDQLEAELKEKERRMNELQLVVSTLTWERDRAVTIIKQQGTVTYTGDQTLPDKSDFASNEIQKLQEQNSELRQVIGQMRKEMEMLCEQIPSESHEGKEPPIDNIQGSAPTEDYVKSLEEEIKDLKQRNREMEEQIQLALSHKDTPDPLSTAKPVPPDNVYIQTHIRSLNETIAALRADKVASAAAAKRLEARTAHLESMVAELTQKFQLNNETRHSQATIAGLQQRQSELELQLSETRKEAEEYFKGNLKQNLETVGLGNEVCALKLELASHRAPVVLSESESVKQLRQEVLTLQQKLASLNASGEGPSNFQILKNKLKEAVKKNSQLIMEKQQLIDMGNKLRAELSSVQANTSKYLVPKTPPSNFQETNPQNRLSELESLQYQLTSQELQYAQYQKTSRVSAENHSNTIAKPQYHRSSSAMQSSERKPTQKENIIPSPRVHHVNSARSLLSAPSLTVGDTSLQDLWKILDMGSSVSLLSSQEESRQGISKKVQLGNHRKDSTTLIPQYAMNKSPSKTGRPANTKHTKVKGMHGTPKIRNYNIKD